MLQTLRIQAKLERNLHISTSGLVRLIFKPLSSLGLEIKRTSPHESSKDNFRKRKWILSLAIAIHSTRLARQMACQLCLRYEPTSSAISTCKLILPSKSHSQRSIWIPHCSTGQSPRMHNGCLMLSSTFSRGYNARSLLATSTFCVV